MDRHLFQRASEVFLAARSKPAAYRTAFVQQSCGDDETLRIQVLAMLRNDESTGGALHTGDGSNAFSEALGAIARQALSEATGGRLALDLPSLPLPERIGRYRIIRQIGQGGMGVVFEAEQDTPRRRVALKVIRAGVLSESALRRFAREVQVLGRLEHPGIARIYDAGTHTAATGEPIPFFAMELIEGAPVDEFVRRHALSARDTLELLANIADALQHAHSKGVIHRDLKPGNILVEETPLAGSHGDDAPGHRTILANPQAAAPRILDFGIARVLDPSADTAGAAEVTAMLGTPLFMAPEQVAGDPLDIDIRTDVYALGVIAWCVLGDRPASQLFHDDASGTNHLADMLNTRTARRLGTIRPELRGDVETIVAKALEHDKTRRYQTAAEFAADVRRFLRHEPILARPASLAYQFGKFARRNRALVIGVAVAIVLLIGGIIGTSLGMNRALHEADKAQRMNIYLRGMISFLNPSEVQGQEITLRQVLDNAARRVDDELGAQPEVAWEMLALIADGYFRVTDFAHSETIARRALAMSAEHFGPDDARTATTQDLLARALFYANKLPEAEIAQREALRVHRLHLAGHDPELLLSFRDLIHMLQLQGKPGEIETLTDQALRGWRLMPTTRRLDHAEATHIMADVLAVQHRVPEAEALYRQSLELYRALATDGQWSKDYLVTLRDFAILLELTGQADEAERLDREAVEVCLQRFGRVHTDTMLSMIGWLGKLRTAGRMEEAEAVAKDVLAIARELQGDHNRDVASAMLNLGIIVRERGRPAEAIEHFSDSATMIRGIQPVNRSELAKAVGGLGMALLDVGRVADAEAPLRECMAIRLESMAPDHPNMAMIRSAVGVVLTEQGKFDEAEPLLVDALRVLRSVGNATPSNVTSARQRVVRLYELWGKPELASKYREAN